MKIHPQLTLRASPAIAAAAASLFLCNAVSEAFSGAEVDRAIADAATYEIGQPRDAIARIEQAVRETQPGSPARPQLEQKLAAFLNSTATTEAKRLVCRQLWIVGTDASIPALEGLLAKPETAQMACFALINFPTTSADALLRRTLDRTTGPAQLAILDTLGNRRDPDAVAPIAQLAAGNELDLALRAIDVLGRIATREAVKALEGITTSPEPQRSEAAKFALLQCAQRLEQDERSSDAVALYRRLFNEPSPRLQCGALIGLAGTGASQAPAAIEAGMDSTNAVVRATAIAQIPRLKGRSVPSQFVKALDTSPPEAQALLIAALAQRGEPSAHPAIAALAMSGHPEVAVAALQALGRLGDMRDVSVLVAMLSPGTLPQRSSAALTSLRQLKGEGVDAAIASSLNSVPTEVKGDLMDVLVTRNAGSALPAMMGFTGSPEPKVYAAAFKAVSRLGTPAQFGPLVAALANLSNRSAEEEAERAVMQFADRIAGMIKPSEVVLTEYSRATAVPARCSLLRVLGETAGPEALRAVVAGTEDSDETVRDTAIRTLAAWPDIAALTDVWSLATRVDRPAHQVLLVRGYLRLLRLPNSRAPEQTLQCYADGLQLANRPDEKRLALAGLGETAPPGALRLVAPLVDDPAIRSEAALAAVKIVKANPSANSDLAKATLQKIADSGVDPDLKKQAAALLKQIP
jgi:HEAT repeat protein